MILPRSLADALVQDLQAYVFTENLLLEKKRVKKGDLIVIVIGLGLKEGSTNMIKIHRVGDDD